MLAVSQTTDALDGRLTALFVRVNNYFVRSKSEIYPTDGFLGGVAAYEYKHGFDIEKPFTVSAVPSKRDANIVDVEITAGIDDKIRLHFNTAKDAFCTNCEGTPLSVESSQKLHSFMLKIN